MKQVYEHTLETAALSLKIKDLDSFLSIIYIDTTIGTITVRDKDYGLYKTDIKSLAPKTIFPLHRLRKFKLRIDKAKAKYIGQKINGVTIIDVFYGPDKGYKNRSFYLICKADCAHELTFSYAILTKHRKVFGCGICNKTLHGERLKIEGKLKKRTPTYVYWVSHKKELPDKYKESFILFKNDVGEKPSNKVELCNDNGILTWVDLSITSDKELTLMSSAIRQAFRHSGIYKSCIDKARIETEQGARYRCAGCLNLFKRKEIQVDHIFPVADVNGMPLDKTNMIDRIWTDKIQILHKACHTKKSTIENKTRRLAKKEKRNKK